MRTIIKPYERNETDYSQGKEVAYLAGGTEVLRLNSSVDENIDLVDLSLVLDKSMEVEGDKLFIHNGVTFSDLIDAEKTPEALRQSAYFCASLALRNSATVCGNVAALRDDSYLLPALLAYDTKVHYVEGSKRSVLKLNEYIKGKKKGLIIALELDRSKKVLIKRIGLASQSHAVLILAIRKDLISCAVKGSGIFYAENLSSLLSQIKFVSDIYGSKEYKEYLVREVYDILKESLK